MVGEESGSAADGAMSEGSVVTRLLAILGAVAALLVAAASVVPFVSAPARECLAQDRPRVICAAGAIGLVDLAALDEKDRRIEGLTTEVAAKTGAVAEAEKRAGDLAGRIKELEGTVAGLQAKSAEADRLRGEIARRDARIAELEKASKRPEPIPVPGARPAAPTTPAPKPKP
jgi:septal ring factor EnvC (AmiA/AmiB activator)